MASRLVVKAMFHPIIQTRFVNNPQFFQIIKQERDVAFVEVSVSSVYGVPKTGLQSSNVTVSLIAAPAQQIVGVDLVFMASEDLAGFYALFLSPDGSPKWPAGEYVFAIAVQAKTAKSVAQGQTLVGFKIVD